MEHVTEAEIAVGMAMSMRHIGGPEHDVTNGRVSPAGRLRWCGISATDTLKMRP